MTEPLHPTATQHLPFFVTAPGETDVLFVAMAFLVLFGVIGIGVFCRLVVDTGMHALGWRRQQAIDFMMDNTSSTVLNITNEIDRYIFWPGQALAYKIGELKIRDPRSQAETRLGERFDLREFHDLVLGSGAVPLGILDSVVQSWIAKK